MVRSPTCTFTNSSMSKHDGPVGGGGRGLAVGGLQRRP
jgi:hypothetical protein